MPETRQSWNIPVKSGDLITVYSGTKQILSYMPSANKGVVIGVDVVETNESPK